MKGVILDADSLGPGDIDLAPITSTLSTWDVHPYTGREDVATRIAGASVVLSNKVMLDRHVLESTGDLRFVSVMATGTNNVDLDAARDLDIDVSNATGYATPSVVQHTLSLMLALSNNLVRYVGDVRAGRWQESKVFCRLDHPITEMSGKTLGIVGFGELGSNVARVAEAFGMTILKSARPGGSGSGDRIRFEDLLPQVDYLSLHCPLTAETENLLNARTLRLMQPHAFVVNTARGALIDSDDLIEALRAGIIAGAAIDVLATEPPVDGDDPLLAAGLPNLLVTPHNAWGARESRERLVEQMRENIESFVRGQPTRLVN